MIVGGADSAAAFVEQEERPVLIVTGLAQEARIAAGPGKTVICSASDPDQLRYLLTGFAARTVRGVISFGVAGGLDPELRTGDVVVATEVVAGDRRWFAGSSFTASLLGEAGVGDRRVIRSRIVGVERVVAERTGKAALRELSGAAACDMESHIAADYAARAQLPFAAIRVISDPASRALPTIATAAIKPDGNIDLGKVLRALARDPMKITSLVSTGRDFNRALRSLRGCRDFLIGSKIAAEAGLAVAEA